MKSVVVIAKDDNIDRMVEDVFAHLGGIESVLRPNSTIVLKPNGGHLGGPESSVNTNPKLLIAVAKAVRKARPREIIMAESSAIGCDTMECLESSGLLEAAREAGVDRIVDIKNEKDLINVAIRDANSALNKVKIPRFLMEAEHIINLPIFKSHASMVFTCALKNLKGVVPDATHYAMHQTDLAMAMMDLWSVIKVDLTIADLIRPAEGFGPHTTIPVDFGCIVAGKDPVAVDATACRMVGLDISRVEYFKAAEQRGLGNYEEEQIEIRGKSIGETFKQMWLPYLEGFETWPEYAIHAENSCSSCQSLVALTMEKLKALGEYDKNRDAVIVLGRKKELPQVDDPRKLILVGDCLKRYRGRGVHVSGCPPVEPHPCWAIIDRQDQTDIGPGFRERMAVEEKPWREYIDRLVVERGNA